MNLQRVILVQDVAGIERGELVVVDYTNIGWHVYHYIHHCDQYRMHRFAITRDPNDENWNQDDWFLVFKDGSVRDYERPNYLHPYFVSGPLFMGHQLYLDDIWLTRSGNADKLERVLSLCNKTLSHKFDVYKFFEWFASHWPDGIFLRDLVKLSSEGRIPD